MDTWFMTKMVLRTVGEGQSIQWMALDQFDGAIGEKRKLVSTSQESTVDFVRIDISIVVMFLKHGLLC